MQGKHTWFAVRMRRYMNQGYPHRQMQVPWYASTRLYCWYHSGSLGTRYPGGNSYQVVPVIPTGYPVTLVPGYLFYQRVNPCTGAKINVLAQPGTASKNRNQNVWAFCGRSSATKLHCRKMAFHLVSCTRVPGYLGVPGKLQ